MNRQIARPPKAEELLQRIPAEFIDDGCSNAPDRLFGFDFAWACRIHDWRYCTRAHPPGTLTSSWRIMADVELREFIRASLPWRWRWVRWIYHAAVNLMGGYRAFDSCGMSAGPYCRHNLRYRKETP